MRVDRDGEAFYDRAIVVDDAPTQPISGDVAPAPRWRAQLGRLARYWPFIVVGVAGAVFTVPVAALEIGTSRARACIASVPRPRGPELPDCRRDISWFGRPSRIPWTATPARYRAEEITLRAAIADYDDAAIGRPDPGALARAADGIVRAAKVVENGSRRIVLDELGRAVGAPDLGRSAMLAGDRRALVDRANDWDFWPTRLRALEAALLEGDVPRASAIARRYAEFDPRDDDLRVAVAAMLCRDGDAARGGEMLESVQNARAKDRHEAWARNWGAVRAVAIACAAKAHRPAPPLPERANAGASDLLEARSVLRLRVVSASDPGDTPPVRTATFDAMQILKGGALPPGARVRILAAQLASDFALAPSLVATLALPHVADGEPTVLPASRTFTAVDWLDEPRGVRPQPSRQALRHAVDRLTRLSASTEIAAEERLALDTIATATAIEAVRAFALAGDAPGAIEILDRIGARAIPNAGARALCRSSAWYLAGDPNRALAELARVPSDLRDEPGLQAAFWLQSAELYASVGRRDEAARAAVLADEAAALAGDRGLEVRASWTRLALARPPVSALRAPPPAPLPGERLWPWVGEIATPSSWLAPPAESPDALARALGFWDEARRAPADVRRAIRYAAATAHRGDAPRALAAYLTVAGQLLGPDEGDVEVWLDAFSATAARKVTMRAYAWARCEAARFRGDADAAGRWAARYRTLAQLAAVPEDAELTAALGI
jgi:hypothetical protein